MKKAKTTITPMLLKSRKKGNNYQVVIRINHNGRYYVNLGNIYASADDWDNSSNRLKRKYPNADVINKLISDRVYEIEQRLYRFVSEGIVFSAKDLSSDSHNIPKSPLLHHIAHSLTTERNLAPRTTTLYYDAIKRLAKYLGKDNITISELSPTMLKQFAEYLKYNKHLTDGTIHNTLAHLASLYNYALSKNLVSDLKQNFNKSLQLSDYKYGTNHRSLSHKQICLITSYFINNYISVNFLTNTWEYKNPQNHLKLGCVEFPLSLFLIGYYFQGLALADLLAIRGSQISFTKRNDVEYMVIEGIKRQKTGVAVSVVVEMDDIVRALISVYLNTMDERGGWLFPVYNTIRFERITDEVVTICRGSVGERIANVVSAVGAELNKGIEDISERFPKRITYYVCRHTFATVYMERGNGNILALASMLGHDVSSTTKYVKALRNIDALIESKKGMF